MCGIVGYIGHGEAAAFLLSGLQRLEYRGYDSAGVAVLDRDAGMQIVRSVGRIERLETEVSECGLSSRVGIGHTRWATHGAATLDNAHPHLGGDGVLALVHNGVIENYQSLKDRLEGEGYEFRSQTDTEVIAHLVASCLKRQPAVEDMAAVAYEPLVSAVQAALARVGRGRMGWRSCSATIPRC